MIELMREEDLSQKAFAHNAEAPESDVSNAFRRKQRLEIDWLAKQDEAFRRKLIARLNRAWGFDETNEAEHVIDDLTLLFNRLLRGMTLRRSAELRRTEPR